MTKAKHTPGPWQSTGEYIRTAFEIGNSKKTGLLVAHCDHSILPEYKANAQLIAAAPELYDALEALLSKVECGSALSCSICEQARAALKKARGEQ